MHTPGLRRAVRQTTKSRERLTSTDGIREQNLQRNRESKRVKVKWLNLIAFLPRKTAESTGKFPPTPMPSTARRDARVTKLFEPPEARPNTPAINRVTLNDHLNSIF